MNIRKIFICLVAVALLTVGTCKTVECPRSAKFANCSECFQYTQISKIQCNCFDYEFQILGKCMRPKYPCIAAFFPYFYNPIYSEFNTWQSVAGFWGNQLFKWTNNDILATSDIVKSIDFGSMDDGQKRGWIQAYYLLMALKEDINRKYPDQSTILQFSKDCLYFAEAIKNIDNRNKWYELSTFLNVKLGTNRTLVETFIFIRDKVEGILPCHNCSDMYGLMKTGKGPICSTCSPGCLSCTNNTNVCNTCMSGYYFAIQKKTCEVCETEGGCQGCKARFKCFKCWPGQSSLYVQADNKFICRNCEEECETCTMEVNYKCLTCNTLVFSSQPFLGKCYVCKDAECRRCYRRLRAKCDQCFEGYYLINSTCYACQPFCNNCTQQQGCIECVLGYGLIDGECKKCKAQGCLSCNENVDACSACLAPHFELQLSNLTCRLTYLMEGAAKEYYLEQVHCRPGCNYCYRNDSSKCFACSERYFWVDFNCEKCMPGCLECTNSKLCRRCTSGYFFQREWCGKCPAFCRVCQNISLCDDCIHGYSLLNGTCVPVRTPECVYYNTSEQANSSNLNCSLCKPGYTITEDYKCIKCEMACNETCSPTNISSCRRSRFATGKLVTFLHGYKNAGCKLEVNGNCVSPEKGYSLFQNGSTIEVKVKCLYPCRICSKDLTKCTRCEDGYMLLGDRCVFNTSCNPNCRSCPAGTQKDEFNNCINCPIDCGFCKKSICYECHEGFYLQMFMNGQSIMPFCVACPHKCRKCYDQYNCRDCSEGYYWPVEFNSNFKPYDCLKCDSNCLTCKYWGSFCMSCPAGTRNVNFQCVNLYHVAYHYVLEGNVSQFLESGQSQPFILAMMNLLKINKTDIFFTVNSQNPNRFGMGGFISVANEQVAEEKYKTMKKTNPPYSNFSIVGKSVSLVNDTKVVDCQSFGKDNCLRFGVKESLSTGAIVGISICSILGVVLVGALTYKFCKWKKAREEEAAENEQKPVSEPPDSQNNFRSLKSEKSDKYGNEDTEKADKQSEKGTGN